MNTKKLKMSADTKESIQKTILLLNLGVITSLEKDLITLNEAEVLLYSPYTMKKLTSLNVPKEVMDIIHLGTELEDVKSLIPDTYNVSIKDIKERTLKCLKNMDELQNVKKWID